MSATDTCTPGEAKLAAVPVATGEPEHEGLVYTLTVEPAAADPFTRGAFSFAGESGSVSLSVGGAGVPGPRLDYLDAGILIRQP